MGKKRKKVERHFNLCFLDSVERDKSYNIQRRKVTCTETKELLCLLFVESK